MTEIVYGPCPRPIVSAHGTFHLIDAAVARAHENLLAAKAARLELEGGEGIKSMATLEVVLRAMASAGIPRDGTLIAIGGGTICDLGGLAAALWMRGIGLEFVPTTLLAMLDASVGGKTAVDLPEGKNLVGAFWPARRTTIDVSFLTTLPEAEVRSGLGEALKMGIGASEELFVLLEEEREGVLARDLGLLEAVIALAIAAKMAIVERDPREDGERRVLNLGHTLGHALEAESGYRMQHGVAVARGLHAAIDLGERRGVLGGGEAGRARELLLGYGFERWAVPPIGRLAEYLKRDKKAGREGLRFVVPTGIGRCEVIEGLSVAEVGEVVMG